MWFEEIQLRFGHSLRLGNAPDFETGPANFSKIHELAKPVDYASFGLFSSPNYQQFAPDATAENVKPKEGDYVQPLYRALSEVIVHKQWNPIDFSENGALKKSMGLLKGQSVKGDHEMGIQTTMGAVDAVSWEDSYKIGNDSIPAGINARLKIDAKVNPNVARLVMMDPPGIHSTSVTVGFNWDKSHPSLSTEEFWSKLGTYDKDGKMIRRVVTLVKYYREISLVDHGADPFAKKIDEKGNIVLPNLAARDYAMNSEQRREQKLFYFDFKPHPEVEPDEISNSDNPTIPAKTKDIQTSNSEIMNKEFLVALAAIYGVTVKDDNLDEAANAIKLAAQKQKDDLAAAQTQMEELKKPNPDLARLTEFKTTTLTAARAKAIASLNKLHDNKPAKALVDVINNMDSIEGIEALTQNYDEAINQKYPLACKACGSHEVSRASSVSNGEENPGKGEEGKQKKLMTPEEIRNQARSNWGSFSSLHGSKAEQA